MENTEFSIIFAKNSLHFDSSAVTWPLAYLVNKRRLNRGAGHSVTTGARTWFSVGCSSSGQRSAMLCCTLGVRLSSVMIHCWKGVSWSLCLCILVFWVFFSFNFASLRTEGAFLVALLVKNWHAHAGDAGSVPGSGRSFRGGNGSPRQSWLGNPVDRGAWQAAVHGVPKSQIQLSD